MSTCLSNARIIDPLGDREFTGSILIKKGKIAEISEGDAPLKSDRTIDCNGLCLAPGIIDVGVKICEPGERHKESFKSAGKAAAAGGITTMVTRPDTAPAIDSPELLEFVHKRAKSDSKVRVVPMAALTKSRQGKEMSEIGFLQRSGAIAFTDGDAIIQDNKIFSRCLTYADALDALIVTHVQDPTLSNGACATSGPLATKLGLSGVSPMAERIQLERDIAIVEMTGARVHIDQISTKAALPALERAKQMGLRLSAGVSIHHLTLNEFDIEGYPTFFKVKPPLRSEDDRLAMGQALADGLIDIISSMHTPQDEESKRLPFEEAASGAAALETLLPAAMQLLHAGVIELPALWRALSSNPAKIFGLPGGRMEKGAPADLVLFDPDKPFVLNRFDLKSKSKNTPFDERRMQGRVMRCFVAGKEVFCA